MMRVRRARQSRELPDIPPEPLAVRDILPTSNIPLIPTPTVGSPQPSLSNSGTSSSHGTVAGTPAPAQAPAKTQGSQGSCTPSPTKSLAPSASKSSKSVLSYFPVTNLMHGTASLDYVPL